MKARRMLLMVLIAAAMVFTTMLNVAYADEDDWQDVPENTEEIDEIETDKTKDVDISSEGETVTFKFTPEEDGVYEFYSEPADDHDYDTIGRIMTLVNGEYEEIASNDDSGDDLHFMMRFSAEAGKTYFLQARMYNKPKEAVSFKVSLVDMGIMSVEYKQYYVPQFSYLIDGYYEEDEDYFVYNIRNKLPSDGDELVINRKDGSSIVYEYDSQEDVFGCVGQEPISRWEMSFSGVDNQDWAIGRHKATVEYQGINCEINVDVVENDIKSFTYQRKQPAEYYENDPDYGEWVEDDEDRYFHYSTPWAMSGDELTVTYNDDTTCTYTSLYDDEEDEYRIYRAEDGSYFSERVLQFSDDQETEHWELGENHYTVKFGGKEYNVPVNIVASPIKEISFITATAEPYEIIENDERYGYWDYYYDDNDERQDFFYYYIPAFNIGDTLTVKPVEGEAQIYKYTTVEVEEDGDTYDRNYFVNDNDPDDMIDPDDISKDADQFGDNGQGNWSLGSDNHFIMYYKAKSCEVPVKIIENPVASMSFEPVSEYVFDENTNGYEEYEEEDDSIYWWYRTPGFVEDDTLIMHMKDDSLPDIVYSYDYDNECFINTADSTDKIYDDDVYRNSGQHKDHWLPDKDNYLTIEYGSLAAKVPVKINKSPINSISYTIAGGYTPAEYDIEYGYVENEGTDNEWFCYDVPLRREGNILTLYTDAAPDGIDYTLEHDSEDGWVYVNGDEKIRYSDVHYSDDQEEKHWAVGEGNTFTITYRRVTCDVNVNVRKNPINSISYTLPPDEPYQIMELDTRYGWYMDEGTEDEWFYYEPDLLREGNILTLYKDDGPDEDEEQDEIQYKLKLEDEETWVYVNLEDEEDRIYYDYVSFSYSYDQYEKHWTVGGDNYVTVSYRGKETKVPVTITGNEVTAISFKPVEDYKYNENEKGYTDEDSSDKEYFYYYEPDFAEGDQLTVTKGEESKVYTYTELDEGFAFINGEEELDSSLLSMDGHQYTNHWTPYDDNYLTVYYCGKYCKVPVTINKSDATLRKEAVKVAKTLLKHVVGINEEDYTFETYAPFAQAKAALEEAIAPDSDSTIDQIKTATQTFSEKFAGLETKVEVAAEKALNTAKALVKEDYTADTYDAVEKAMIALERVLNDDNSTNANIENATKALNDAIAGLKTKEQDAAEKEAVAKEIAKQDADTALKSAADLKAEDYTEDSYKAVTDAKAALEAVLKNDKATSTDINNAVKALTDAMAGLKTKEAAAKETAKQDADKALKNAADLKADDYTEDSYKAVADAKAALETVLKNDKATSTDINSATKALNDAISGLKTKAEDAAEKEAASKETAKQDADAAIKSADAVKADDYTEDTYKAVADAKTALEAVLKNDKATSTDINNAVKALSDAMAGLKTKAEDAAEKEAAAKEEAKKNADTAITGADAVKADDYTEDTYKAVADAKAALEAVLKDEKATSADINDAIKALSDAMAGLKTKAEAEKEEAEKQEAAAKAQAMADADAAIAEINALDPAGFTEESYSAVLDAIAALEAVLKDEKATSVQINDAIKALRAAKEALKAKEEPAVEKLDNTMKVTAKKVTVKFKSLRKKNQTVKKKNAFTVKKPAGKVTFKLYKKDKKAKNKITINKKGNITVKKGLKKGKYTIKVKVTAAGNDTYKKLTKQVKVKITVK